jgi:uncharacterized membrane protein
MGLKRFGGKILENFADSPDKPTPAVNNLLTVIVSIILVIVLLFGWKILDLNSTGIIITIAYVAIFFVVMSCIFLHVAKRICETIRSLLKKS